jgi:hypothetical protein
MTGIIAPTLQDLSGPGLELPGCGPKDAIEDTLRIHRDPELAARGIGAPAAYCPAHGVFNSLSE